jgi:hypothetical protein
MKSIILYFTIFMMGAASAATFTVTTVNNDVAGSLRRAIEDANAAPGPDTIVFDTAGVFATQQAIVLNSPIPPDRIPHHHGACAPCEPSRRA